MTQYLITKAFLDPSLENVFYKQTTCVVEILF